MARGDQRCSCKCHWDWSWLNPAFNGTKISAADIDGVVERNGAVVFLEAKHSDQSINGGQKILLGALSEKSLCSSMVLYGERNEPSAWQICHNGVWQQKNRTTKSEIVSIMTKWFSMANRFELKPKVESQFSHLLNLCKALRISQKGNLALGEKPNLEVAKRLETALDHFIAECESRKENGEQK